MTIRRQNARRRRTPSQVFTFPEKIEKRYRARVLALHKILERAWISALEPLIKDLEERERREAESERRDAPEDVALLETIEGVDIRLGEPEISSVAGDAAEGVSEHNARELGSVLGIDPRSGVDQIEIDRFIRDNVDLITGLNGRLRSQIRADVERAIRDGITGRRLRTILEERLNVSRSRARLIARDQIGKLQGQLNRTRQMRAGVTQYRWAAINDERTRGRHGALGRGGPYSWLSPPVVDLKTGRREHPGGDYQCRCQAIPVISFDDIDQRPRERTQTRARTIPRVVRTRTPEILETPTLPVVEAPIPSPGSIVTPTQIAELASSATLQMQVFGRILAGQTPRQIASALGVSVRTVLRIAQRLGLTL